MWCTEIYIFSFLQLWISVNCFNCIKQKGVVIESKLTTPINWIKDSINSHNKYRFEHGSQPLVFNESLCLSAQWTANTILTSGFVHTSMMAGGYSMSCGENLYKSAGTEHIRLGHEPVDSWYSEEADYDYEKGAAKTLNKPVGHFTQLIWKASKQVCVAYAMEGTKFVVVAHYFPRGNVKKRYVENIGVRKFSPPKPTLNPWMEIFCDKVQAKGSKTRRFKCHYRGLFSQLSPKSKMSLSRKETKKLVDKVISNDKLSAFVELPLRNV